MTAHATPKYRKLAAASLTLTRGHGSQGGWSQFVTDHAESSRDIMMTRDDEP